MRKPVQPHDQESDKRKQIQRPAMALPESSRFLDAKAKQGSGQTDRHTGNRKEVGSQAISYTTGVPAMCGALMMLTGKWIRPGVYTVEEFDPDPFLEALDKYGLPRSENHNPELVD